MQLGNWILAVFNPIPMAILGVLLRFAGSQLALTILDVTARKELFVVVTFLGNTPPACRRRLEQSTGWPPARIKNRTNGQRSAWEGKGE